MQVQTGSSNGDPRPVALGVARLLFGAFIIFAIYALISEIQLSLGGVFGPGRALSLASVGVWALGTIGLIHNGRRMRKIAAYSFLAILFAAIAVSVAGFFDQGIATSVTMLAMAGAHYYYIPLIGSVVALGWLVYSNPRRLSGR